MIIGSVVAMFVRENQYWNKNRYSSLPANFDTRYLTGTGLGVVSAEIGLWKGARNRRRLFEVVKKYNKDL